MLLLLVLDVGEVSIMAIFVGCVGWSPRKGGSPKSNGTQEGIEMTLTKEESWTRIEIRAVCVLFCK